MLMIKNTDLKSVHMEVQEILKHDITEIRNTNKILVPTDKNLYSI